MSTKMQNEVFSPFDLQYAMAAVNFSNEGSFSAANVLFAMPGLKQSKTCSRSSAAINFLVIWSVGLKIYWF
ncbi:hypothetical protein PBAL39_10241 [Pedobacter sp. BAL39]|nr:hypothetical protein PBAL39_10241 [Pedobacter sp. BAL39]